EMYKPLWKTPLEELTALDIALHVAKLRAAGRGPSRVQRSFKVLRRCLDAAVRLEQLSANPIRDEKAPSWEPQVKEYWKVEQTRRFIDTALASRHRHARLFVFLATTGLRISEALALTWADVDLDAKTVQITKALVHVAGVYHEMPP